MAHLQKSEAMSVTNNIMEEKAQFIIKEPTIAEPYKRKFIIENIIFFAYAYLAGLYGLYLCFTSAKWGTIVFTIMSYIGTLLGITAGAHRLFAHKSYKATKPLQIFLMLCHCLAYQRTLYKWVRDHRLHHKYSDTDADPHNASRGFFFSHVGWLLVKSHPEMEKRKSLIDMSDVLGNEVLMFQKRNISWLLPLIGMILPTAIPWLLGDTFSNCWHLNVFRFMLTSNLTFLTNSLSHSWGYKPYDKTTKACQSLPVILVTYYGNISWLLPLIGMILPTAIPWLLGDTFSNCWHLNVFRFMLTSNLTFLTNSLSHSWGYKPYDKTTKACQSLPVILVTMGEGFHNYHHAFPWDYRAGELGNNSCNYITKAIDWFERVGLAYDLKQASDGMIEARKKRTGDGTDLWGQRIQKDE